MSNSNVNQSSVDESERTIYFPIGKIIIIGLILGGLISIYFMVNNDFFLQTNDIAVIDVLEKNIDQDTHFSIEAILFPINDKESIQSFILSEEYQKWIFSGPFAINKYTYKYDEQVHFLAVNIPYDDSGQIIIMSPGDIEFRVIDYDGSKDEFNKFDFIPKTKNVKKCPECTFGKWKISFESNDRSYYSSIYFNVKQ